MDGTLIAPTARPHERLLGYGCGVAGAAFAGALAVGAAWPVLPAIVLVVIGFDLFGGVVVNATPSGSRRFHTPDSPRWRGLGFVAAHVHPLLLACMMPEMPWMTAVVAYAGSVLAAALVILVPNPLRAPTAFGVAAVLIAMSTSALAAAPVVAWVVPLLIVKLLLSHLLPHPANDDVAHGDLGPGHRQSRD